MITTKHEITKDELMLVPIPVREETTRWKGIQHGVLANEIIKQVKCRDIEITNETWDLSKDQQVLVGSMNLDLHQCNYQHIFREDRNAFDIHQDMTYSLAIIHSNNSKFALKFVIGAQVFVCLNGVISGDFLLSKKHTTNLELGIDIRKGITRFLDAVPQVYETVYDLKNKKLTNEKADHLLMELGRTNLLGWSAIGKINKEFEHSSFTEFGSEKYKNTGWALYNAGTYIAHQFNPQRQLIIGKKFKEIILSEAA